MSMTSIQPYKLAISNMGLASQGLYVRRPAEDRELIGV